MERPSAWAVPKPINAPASVTLRNAGRVAAKYSATRLEKCWGWGSEGAM